MIQKFDTEKEADEFIDFEIEDFDIEVMNCNCDGELINVGGFKRIWKLKTFKDRYIVIIDLIVN